MIIIDMACTFCAYDKTAKLIRILPLEVPENTTLLSNADDPSLKLDTYFANTRAEVIQHLTTNLIKDLDGNEIT